ncbi:U-box domain-containing protein 36-like [Bidens hawaiensis]|uniref:U-box domain-containing protein 36-like n=1 Tax=Bidens hawaiensis TaxID=980011 RepID=UPI00404AA8A6
MAVVEDKVYVAVGKKSKESLSSLLWAIPNSGGRQITVLHVHQPAHEIPISIRRLDNCHVSADVIYTEKDSIEGGIIELILEHNIKRLVMGAAADRHYSRTMVDLRSTKAIFVRLQAPSSCHIHFLCKGNIIFTRLDEPAVSVSPTTNSDSG